MKKKSGMHTDNKNLWRFNTLAFYSVISCMASPSALQASQAAAKRITVAAAMSLKPLFDKNFSDAEKGQIDFVYGGSQILLQQFKNNAPIDLLITAEPDLLKDAIALTQHGTMSPVIFTNALKLAKQPTQKQTDPLLIIRDAKKIAIGGPKVPAGDIARKFLADALVTDATKDRLVQTENVAQVTAYLVKGIVDAGFIYESECLSQKLECVPLLPAGSYNATYKMLGTDRCEEQKASCHKVWDKILSKEMGQAARSLGFQVGL